MVGFRLGAWGVRRVSRPCDMGSRNGGCRGRRPQALLVAGLVGSVGLCACTISLEVAEPRFAPGDLAASSMGLVAHDAWFGSPGERAKARPRSGEGIGAADSRAAVYRYDPEAHDARETGAEPLVVPLAPDLARAASPARDGGERDHGFGSGFRAGIVPADRLSFPDPYALMREPANGPAPAPPDGRSTGIPVSESLSAPSPTPPKPHHRAEGTWSPR